MTKAQQMYALIDARAASGKTVVDYCAEHGISRAKYNYWQLRRKREQAADRGSAFIAVAPAPEALSVRLSGGLRLEFRADQLDAAADLLLKMDAAHARLQ